MMTVDWKALAAPFREEAIEWRIQQAGEKNGKPWATCLAYLTARAVMDRLDAVVGPENWTTGFRPLEGGVECTLYIQGVAKADVGTVSDIEPLKGAYSDALKRAAVHWGVGRYLYGLDSTFAQIHNDGRLRGRTKEGTNFRWDPPRLPKEFLP